MKRILLRRHPFLAATITGLILSSLLGYSEVQYDSGGLVSGLLYLALLMQFPIWIAHELIYAVPSIKALNFNNSLVLVAGLAIACVLDYALSLLISLRERKKRGE